MQKQQTFVPDIDKAPSKIVNIFPKKKNNCDNLLTLFGPICVVMATKVVVFVFAYAHTILKMFQREL